MFIFLSLLFCVNLFLLKSAYNASTSENVNDLMATIFIPLTQFDDMENSGMDDTYNREDHENVFVFPKVKPTFQQQRLSKATFADKTGKNNREMIDNNDDICNDSENKLTINANKGDALLIWSLSVGGTPDPKSQYVHCRSPTNSEHRIGIRNGNDLGTGSGKNRIVASIRYSVKPEWGKGRRVNEEANEINKPIRKIYKPSTTICRDKSKQCAEWSESGECTRNPGYMRANCSRSCHGVLGLDSCVMN